MSSNPMINVAISEDGDENLDELANEKYNGTSAHEVSYSNDPANPLEQSHPYSHAQSNAIQQISHQGKLRYRESREDFDEVNLNNDTDEEDYGLGSQFRASDGDQYLAAKQAYQRNGAKNSMAQQFSSQDFEESPELPGGGATQKGVNNVIPSQEKRGKRATNR